MIQVHREKVESHGAETVHLSDSKLHKYDYKFK